MAAVLGLGMLLAFLLHFVAPKRLSSTRLFLGLGFFLLATGTTLGATGAHFCLGAGLARMEARAAIGGLFRRFPQIELQSEALELGASLFRVPGRLPAAITD